MPKCNTHAHWYPFLNARSACVFSHRCNTDTKAHHGFLSHDTFQTNHTTKGRCKLTEETDGKKKLYWDWGCTETRSTVRVRRFTLFAMYINILHCIILLFISNNLRSQVNHNQIHSNQVWFNLVWAFQFNVFTKTMQNRKTSMKYICWYSMFMSNLEKTLHQELG